MSHIFNMFLFFGANGILLVVWVLGEMAFVAFHSFWLSCIGLLAMVASMTGFYLLAERVIG